MERSQRSSGAWRLHFDSSDSVAEHTGSGGITFCFSSQATLQLDGPGAYLLASDVDVFEAPARSSRKVGRLPAGEEVYVLEVVHRKAEKRIRGRVALDGAYGWISLLDTSEGYRWAHRQLGATNEWIGFGLKVLVAAGSCAYVLFAQAGCLV